jgi:hypothetical protein
MASGTAISGNGGGTALPAASDAPYDEDSAVDLATGADAVMSGRSGKIDPSDKGLMHPRKTSTFGPRQPSEPQPTHPNPSHPKPLAMVISHQRKLLFIHIPKCAGESITEWLLAPQHGGTLFLRKHDRYTDAEQALGAEINGYHCFSVVRNPFEQVLSFYEHLRKPLVVPKEELERQYPGSDGRLAPQWASRLAMEMDFPGYVRTVYAAASRQKRNAAWFDDMLSFLSAVDGRPAVSRILRFENLSEDIGRLAADTGLQGQPPIRNTSPTSRSRHDYHSHYDESSRRIVEAWFAPTLQHFGYRF